MARYAWVGRARGGSVVQGVLEAPSRDAALAQLRASGVVVTSVTEGGDAGEGLVAGPALPVTPVGVGRTDQARSDRRFSLMLVLVSSAIGLGITGFGPVLRYDCRRDASGAVACHVERRVLGLVPLAPVDAGRILSVSVEYHAQSRTMVERDRDISRGRARQESTRLALVCSSGPCWTSPGSSWPMGASNEDIAQGIQELLAAGEPGEYGAWQAEKVTLLVAAAFQLPMAFVLLGLVLRLTVGRFWTAEELQARAAKLSRRRR